MDAGLEHPINLRPLSPKDGGGWLAEVPELPGCMTDGESPVEALSRVPDAIDAWKDAAREMGRSVPAPAVKSLTAAE